MAGAKLYEVGSLLKQRQRGNTVEYLVRWKEFTGDHDSWEPESNLLNCKNEIETFKQQSASSSKSKTPKKSPSRTRAISKSPAREKSLSPPVTRSKSPARKKSVSPVKTPSKSPGRKKSVSPARKKSVSPAKKRSKSPAQRKSASPAKSASKSKPKASSRSRSRSRTRLASAIKISTGVKETGSVVRSRSATRKTTVTTTSIDAAAAGEPGRYSHTVQTSGRKVHLESVVVPRSLQQAKPAPQKGFLEEVTLKDVFLIFIVSMVIVLTAAHHYKYIDLNEYLVMVKSKIDAFTASSAAPAAPAPPTTSAPPTTTKPPK